MSKSRARLSLSVILSFTTALILSQETATSIPTDSLKTSQRLQTVMLSYNSVLDGFSTEQRTGSAQKLTKQEIKKIGALDPNRLFQRVAGIQVYEEDGFGLRPNISMRGTAPQRSAKINLMEDGILMAPAPYSAPAAYYFPSLGRMDAIEVYKGSSQIEYGPNTSGGAINFLSAPLPQDFTFEAQGTAGRFDTNNQQISFGNKHQDFSYIAQWLGYQSNGFKQIDGGGPSGFNKQDVLGKFQWTPQSLGKKHALIFKVGLAQEEANETYLGLSQEHFDQNPLRRYASSSKDQMKSYHQQFSLTHLWSPNKFISLKTVGYNNIFRRNWYKLDKVTAQGETLSLAQILNDPETFPLAYQSLTGPDNLDQTSLAVKANNRRYFSRGIQSQLDWQSRSDPTRGLSIGIRVHQDAEDRFQWVDTYRLENQKMNLIDKGIRGSDANQIKKATALSGFVLLTQKIGKFTLKPGIRLESIALRAVDYGPLNLDRIGLPTENTLNTNFVVIPGLGFCYKWDNQTTLFGGLHKGFSPPGFTPEQESEISWNNELGLRHNQNNFSAEAVGFFNHFERLLGSDLAAAGGYGNNERFNAGSARVWGLETNIAQQFTLSKSKKIVLPISLVYTWTKNSFLSAFESDNVLFGSVQPEDEMPYIAPHQGSLMISLTHPRWSAHLNTRYQSAQRSVAGQGPIGPNQIIPQRTIIDLALNYQISEAWSTQLSVINATDQVYLAARHPAGLRPGHPRGISLSLNYRY